MSTRKHHIEQAERLLDEAQGQLPITAELSVAAAQVHATLAALYPAPYNKDADE